MVVVLCIGNWVELGEESSTRREWRLWVGMIGRKIDARGHGSGARVVSLMVDLCFLFMLFAISPLVIKLDQLILPNREGSQDGVDQVNMHFDSLD